MPLYTEQSELNSLEIFPSLNVINVRKTNTTFKDGVKFSEQKDNRSYSTEQFSDFEINVAPLGDSLLNIVAGFSEAAVAALQEIPATLAVKNQELADKDQEISSLQTAHATALSVKDQEKQTALAAKDAIIAELEARVEELTPPEHNGVPQSVTRRQARQALLLAGLLDAVPLALAAIPDATQSRLAQIEWEDSLTFERQRPLLIQLSTALGLNSEQLDQLFITADGL